MRGSLGVVEGPAGERSPAEVLRSADITMYRAKSAGGNRFELADPEADARAITRHGLTTALPAALERGEFFIEYQPLVHLGDSATVHGAEALVRWLHPQHGVLGPDRFIPLAEHTGLIVPLGPPGCWSSPSARPGRNGKPTATRAPCGSTSTSRRPSSTTPGWCTTRSTSWNAPDSNRSPLPGGDRIRR
ncbi:hypothetical protein SCALM49S_09670 [Streptomyces californicus]